MIIIALHFNSLSRKTEPGNSVCLPLHWSDACQLLPDCEALSFGEAKRCGCGGPVWHSDRRLWFRAGPLGGRHLGFCRVANHWKGNILFLLIIFRILISNEYL